MTDFDAHPQQLKVDFRAHVVFTTSQLSHHLTTHRMHHLLAQEGRLYGLLQ